MVKEIDRGEQIPSIENREQFSQWLEETKPPPEMCVVLAERAILRALPTLMDECDPAGIENLEAMAARVFRAIAPSSYLAKYPNIDNGLQNHLAAAFKATLAEAKKSERLTSPLISAVINVTKAANFLLQYN